MNNKSFYVMLESDLILDKRINSTVKMVYAVICNYSNNKHGYCYLNYSQLYDILNVKKRYFINCINELVKYNYLSKIKKGNRIYLMPIVNRTIAMRNYKTEQEELFDYNWLEEKES